MFSMYLDGYSYQEIGKEFKISRQAVEQQLRPAYWKRASMIASCVYPNVRKWLRENNYSFRRLANELGFECGNGTPASITNILRGKQELRAKDIKKLATVTGLTYEQIMERDGDNTETNEQGD